MPYTVDMNDPLHETILEQLWRWFRTWGWIWLSILAIMAGTLWLAGELNP